MQISSRPPCGVLIDLATYKNYARCMPSEVESKKISDIFAQHNLGEVSSVKKIPAGFTNDVYLVNDQYIFKSCKDLANTARFKQEIEYYRLFEDKIPVPNVLVADESFMIYKKIEGDNLFNIWHKITDEQRMDFVRQICDILKIINQVPVDKQLDWHQERTDAIAKLLETAQLKKILNDEMIERIRGFVDEHHQVLKAQMLGLTYWDMHFDNVIVRDGQVVGLLDFEGVEVMSIDYVLDTVRRLTNYPQIYASEHAEKKIKDEDYAKLYAWFKQYYPELFAFNDIDRRVDLYAVEYDLELLMKFTDSEGLKARITDIISR